MVRSRWRRARGCRLIGKQPWGHWKTTIFTAGPHCGVLTAPGVLDVQVIEAAGRSRDGFWDRIGQVLRNVTPEECANCFRRAGYEPT